MLSVAQVDKIIYGFSVVLTRILNLGKHPERLNFKRILVLRFDEIGDLCYTSPVFKMLRARDPDAEITFWCRGFGKELFSNCPYLDHIVSDEKELRGRYDLVVDLRGKWKGLGFALKHQPVIRVDRGTVRLKYKNLGEHPHQWVTNAEVLLPLFRTFPSIPQPELFPSENSTEQADAFLTASGIRNFAVLHTGARRVLRQWPSERFAEIANLLHHDYGLQVLFAGDRDDEQQIDNIRKSLSFPTWSLAGVLSLGAFTALCSKAAIYVGNESGPLHIASVSGAPVIGLYGPGEPRVFYPLNSNSRVLHHILPCNPCDQVHCVHPEWPCIQRISVEEVSNAISSLIKLPV